jgi:hypothetical protein
VGEFFSGNAWIQKLYDCCDDCCGYFLDPSERCNKGEVLQEQIMIGVASAGNA